MCRMVGVISCRPMSPYYYLVESECSLLRQAEVSNQGDGWGIGFYYGGELKVFKRANAAYDEKDLFMEVSREAVSNISIAHVRKASNPMGLPRRALISVENSQPFYHKKYLFAHNGVVRALEVAEALGEHRSLIRGVNDSEIYFAYLLKEWEERGDPIDALRAVEDGLWRAFGRSGKSAKNPFSSLNAIFSDGIRLYAVTRYLEGGNLRSVCYKDAEYYRMAFYYDGSKLVVASERMDDKKWGLLSNGEVLIAELEDDRVKYRVEEL